MTAPMAASAASPSGSAIDAGPATPPGLRSAVRLLFEHLGDHIDLLRLDLGRELSRFAAVVGCWFALALLLQLSLMMGLTLLVALYWETEYRLQTVLLSATLLLGGMGYCLLQLRRLGRQAAARFAVSGVQFKRDLDLIRELI